MDTPDAPIPYRARIRDYYKALGYGKPYDWAHYAEVPFHALDKPLSETRVALIVTAAPALEGKSGADAKFFKVYSGACARDHDLLHNHVAVDTTHTTGEDQASYFPLKALRAAAAAKRILLAPRFHGMPTNRSHRTTLDVDCAEVLARCRADGAGAAILVPNCPVCHQTLSLAARTLEAGGIASAVMGCAKDIVEYIGVPRFLFSDFPLGNGAGRPNDAPSQDTTLELALRLLETAPGPRITLQSPLRWSESPDWKRDYANAERLTPEVIAEKRAGFDRAKAVAKTLREEAGLG